MLLKVEELFTTCKKRRVAALMVQPESEVVRAISHNVARNCNAQCDKTCGAIHAEARLPYNIPGCDVYLTRYPCVSCYNHLVNNLGVKHIYVFDRDYKNQRYQHVTCLPDVLDTIGRFNGNIVKQEDVMIGEMGEYITEVMNSRRKDARESYRLEELVDVLLQLILQFEYYRTVDVTEATALKLTKLEAKFETDSAVR